MSGQGFHKWHLCNEWTDKHNHEKRPIQLRDYDRKYKKKDSWGNKVKKSAKRQEDDI